MGVKEGDGRVDSWGLARCAYKSFCDGGAVVFVIKWQKVENLACSVFFLPVFCFLVVKNTKRTIFVLLFLVLWWILDSFLIGFS